MVDQKVSPTPTTIDCLIRALCIRDKNFNGPEAGRKADRSAKGTLAMSDDRRASYPSAVALFRSLVAPVEGIKAVAPGSASYSRLITAAARHRDPETARELFLDLDARAGQEPVDGVPAPAMTYDAFASLVRAFGFANVSAVGVAFGSFRANERAGKIAREGRAARVKVWVAAIEAYLQCGDEESAKKLFAEIVAARPSRDSPSTAEDSPTEIDGGLELSPAESEDLSLAPQEDAQKLLGRLISRAKSHKVRRLHATFVDLAISSAAEHSPGTVKSLYKAAVDFEAAEKSAGGLCSLLRTMERVPDEHWYLSNYALRRLFDLGRLEPAQFEIGYRSARAILEHGVPVSHTVGSAIVAQLVRMSTSVETITSFHRQALLSQAISNSYRRNYHRQVLSALLRHKLPDATRQLKIAFALTAVGEDLGAMGSVGSAESDGRIKDIFRQAKAELGGDITQIGLTSSSVGFLLEHLAVADQVGSNHQRNKPSSSSRKTEVSLVEEFVTDLVAAGEKLGEISVPRLRAQQATRILGETMGRAEAQLVLAPFLEEAVDEPAEPEVESEAALPPQDRSAGDVGSVEAEQGEVTKLPQPAFDFQHAPWRSLIEGNAGLVALLPKKEPESEPSESEPVESVAASSETDPVASTSNAPPADSIASLFFDPPSVNDPPPLPPGTDAEPSAPAPTPKKAKQVRPKKTAAQRSAQLLDARLSTLLQTYDPSTALSSYQCLRECLATGHVPRPWLISRVGEALGRRAEHKKVLEVVELLEHLSEGGRAWSWEQTREIHSDVIAAFAYCKDTVSTEYHTQYLLEEMGTNPNAKAYGALIFNGTDATKDGSYAVKLWQDARKGNPVLHRHLYNGMMKAFGNVGKVDEAVQLLDKMRATQGKATPSWASYGFAIVSATKSTRLLWLIFDDLILIDLSVFQDACLKAGRLDQAKELYAQMHTETLSVPRRQFKPSILPFTSMMQHYATREPDRDALVRIDGDLRDLDLMPHSLTYEVLINAFGSISPVDKNTMWDILELLEANQTQHAQIQGMHWAAMIRSLGIDSKQISFLHISSPPTHKR